jgi:hypothetical protein
MDQFHATIPLEILDRFVTLFDAGHTPSAGSGVADGVAGGVVGIAHARNWT